MRGNVYAPSAGQVPGTARFNENTTPTADAVSPLSRAYVYNATGAGAAQLAKHPLSAVTPLTNIGASQTVGFLGAAAWLPTTNTMYVIDQLAPFPLYIVDTLTGVRSFIANCTGVPLTGGFTGLTYDATTATWYGACITGTLTQSQIFTVNIGTGVCTPIGSASAVCPGAITLNAANDGTLYSVDLVTDNLFRWNKATGVPTVVGPLGIDCNFGQDAHFDPSDGQLLWAAFNNVTFTPQLRTINLATGASTLEGTYAATQIATIAIYPGIPPPACSGTPVPGNTLSTSNPVCPNATFFLSTQTPAASGLVFTWQSAPAASGPWTTFGGTGSTQSASQTVATYYRAIVACGANPTATSAPLQVTMNGFNSCYCLPTYTNACAAGDYIARVRLNTLDNSSVCGGQFTYYSAVPAPSIFPGVSSTVTVTVGPDTFGQWVGVWIDYNQDGIFTPAEMIAAPVNAGASGTVNINFTVPPGATLGTTRMRIRGGDDVAMLNTQACGASNSTFGEAEDYNVNITPCVQGVFTAQPASVSVQCSNNATFSFTATGSVLAYSWEYRVNASSPWLVVPNAAPYSNVNTNTLTITNASATMSGYQYRGIMQGPCTAVDFTNIVTLTVTPLIATVSPTSATICTGSVQQLTLTNVVAPATVTYPSGTINLPILDGVVAGVNNTINVAGIPANAVPSKVGVILNITHAYVADLEIVLRAPNGKRINLSDLIGGQNNPGANFTNTFISSGAGLPSLLSGTPPWTGEYRPDAIPGPTGGFGVPAGPTGFLPNTTVYMDLTVGAGALNGAWTIAMYDAGPPDPGVLNNWSLVLTYGAAAQGVWTGPAGTMYNDAGLASPYIAGTPATSIFVNPTVTSTYSVVYSTATPCVSAPTNVVVNVVNPVTAVVAPTNKTACVGTTATFTTSAGGGPLTYQWQVSTDAGLTWNNVVGATSATLTLPAVTQTMNGYRYRAIIAAPPCGGSTTTASATLTVNALPTVAITAPDLSLTPGQTTTITATSSPAAAANGWTWTLDGSAIAGTTNTQSVNIDGLGTYRARVVDVNGCIAFSNNLTIGAEASDRLWIYPNPNGGVFQVRLYYGGPVTERRVVRLYKSNGQLVMEKEFTLDNIVSPYLRMDFDLGVLASGTYVVKVDNTVTGKITSGLVVIQHE